MKNCIRGPLVPIDVVVLAPDVVVVVDTVVVVMVPVFVVDVAVVVLVAGLPYHARVAHDGSVR